MNREYNTPEISQISHTIYFVHCWSHLFFVIELTSHYNFSSKMAEAPPPPLQIAAIPNFPGCKLCTKWPVIRAPDILQMKKYNKFKEKYNG